MMRVLLCVVFLVCAVGCIPPKVDVYPTIQMNDTVAPTPVTTQTATFSAPPETIQPPSSIIPPSAPNLYLNQTKYNSIESYFNSSVRSGYTVWTPRMSYYQQPTVIPTADVFWTGTVDVTVE
jgi:hypothetical protein